MKRATALCLLTLLFLTTPTWAQNLIDVQGPPGGPSGFVVNNQGRVGINTDSPSFVFDLRQDNSTLRLLNLFTDVDAGQTVNFERLVPIGSIGNDLLQLQVPDTSLGGQFIEAQFPNNIRFRVNIDGSVTADGTITGGGADYADLVVLSGGLLSAEPADVLVIDPDNPHAVTKSFSEKSTLVAGIYSTQPGFVGSETDLDQAPQITAAKFLHRDGESSTPSGALAMAAMDGRVPVAMVGIVPTRVSAENGAIEPGDLLVTSRTPGHAMRDDDPKVGTVLGKAMGRLQSGTGVIRVLVTLQ